MRYLSLCSGIASEAVAWKELGWECEAFAETDKHASAVLESHYPDIPNLGDITQVNWKQYRAKTDLIIGGVPCQPFSVAGLRRGESDGRNLTLEYVNAVRTAKPRFFILEQVPGILSDKNNAFGCLLAGLLGEDSPIQPPQSSKWDNAGFFLGQDCAIAYRILDSQYFGVPQRRRRIFLLGMYFRDCGRLRTAHWGDLSRLAGLPAAILFESEGERRNFEEGKEKRQGASSNVGKSFERVASCIPLNTQVVTRGKALGERTGIGYGNPNDPAFTLQANHAHAVAYRIGGYNSEGFKSNNPYAGVYKAKTSHGLQSNGSDPSCHQGGMAVVFNSGNYSFPISNNNQPAPTLSTAQGGCREHMVCLSPRPSFPWHRSVSPTLGTSACDRGGREHIVCFQQNTRNEVRLINGNGQLAGCLASNAGAKQQNYIAFSYKGSGQDANSVVVPTIRRGSFNFSHANSGCPPAIAFMPGQGAKAGSVADSSLSFPTLKASSSGTNRTPAVAKPLLIKDRHNGGDENLIISHQVRKLTPVECARLQGFPDDYLETVFYQGKPLAKGAKYKLLGNAITVNVLNWLGKRIENVTNEVIKNDRTSNNR